MITDLHSQLHQYAVSLAPAEGFEIFWEKFWAGMPEVNHGRLPEADWKRIAKAFWKQLESDEPDKAHIDILDRNKTTKIQTSGICITIQHMDFLVDAISGLLENEGYKITFSNIQLVSKLQDDNAADNYLAMLYLETDYAVPVTRHDDLFRKIYELLADIRLIHSEELLMFRQFRETLHDLLENATALDPEDVQEALSFIEWLDKRHFVFLGYRRYDYTYENDEINVHIAKTAGLGILRDVNTVLAEETALERPELKNVDTSFLTKKNIIAFHRSAYRTHILRHNYYDRFAIRFFDKDGATKGAHLFVGLLSPLLKNLNPNEVPFIRRKTEHIFRHMGYSPNSHQFRELVQLLNDYPRDELFLTPHQMLLEHIEKALNSSHSHRPAVLMREDVYKRYLSFIIYIPHDNYSQFMQVELQKYLSEICRGVCDRYMVNISGRGMTQIHVIIVESENSHLVVPEIHEIEKNLNRICASWNDEFKDKLFNKFGEDAHILYSRYMNAFPVSFKEAHDPASTIEDIISVEKLLEVNASVVLAFTAHNESNGHGTPYHLSFYHEGDPISPLKLLRIVENFGLTPVSDSHYTCKIPVDGEVREVHIHDFPIKATPEQWEKLDPRQDVFEEALQAIWENLAGNDRLNELLFLAEMTLPEVVLLRAIGRYLMQARLPYSQEYYSEMLVRHAPVMRAMVDYFHAKFDPQNHSDERAHALLAQIENYITQVRSIDEDRVLRRVLNIIQATVRTNYYQRDRMGREKPQLTLKLRSMDVLELPKPLPLYETFVYAHRVEGIHLRSSKIARGGLRWSDRREDFRDEVLDLMKAQTVKNSVIVPTGAKGGFYVKYPPIGGDRKAVQEEAIACYQIFIRGLLDVTDNVLNKKVVRPQNVICYDDEDPYLVVAADKGTATFSDIANAISMEYNHWLGDAFASGGSAGYDHKVMGITARGAWESVRHHGHHLNINVDKDVMTAVGVGDMGGDVFGNGMLLSKHLKLIGAFSYSHIFCDPNPDAARSYAERERLFKAVANWDQYDPKLLSNGGRIYSRAEKELELTPEIQAAFNIEQTKVTPAELMRAILRAQVDLLWFGGIGTYVRASNELDMDVRDKANDFIRITAPELRCKIVGEGANLGMTQRGRIEAGARGIALNTDFIDNSAGVNSSDYEVNIKILLNTEVAQGKLDIKQRNKLLESMQDEVAQLVLDNNRAQNTALGIAESMAPERLEHFNVLIQELEQLTSLDRKLEALPTPADIERMNMEGTGLTRPEISVIMSHTKLLITHTLAKDPLMQDPAVLPLLDQYFPKEIVKRFPESIRSYALKEQLVAMLLSNMIINQASVYMPKWLSDRTGLGYADIARAFLIASELFNLRAHWESVQDLTSISGKVQRGLLIELMQHVDRTLPWLLNQNDLLRDISGTIRTYQPHFAKASENILSFLPPERLAARNAHENRLIAEGVPAHIACSHANIRSLAAIPSVIALALDLDKSVVETAKLYFLAGERFGFDRLRELARQTMRHDYWQRQAISALIEDFSAHQLRLTRAILQQNQTLQEWCMDEHQLVERLDTLMRELHTETTISVTQLTVANRRLRGLVPSRSQ